MKRAQDLATLNPRCEYAPADFNYPTAISSARAFFAAVRESFPEALLDDHVQDATYHAGISVDGSEIRLSNFGLLAAITSEESLTRETLSRLVRLIESAGYTYVPFAVFGEPFLTRERFTGDLFTQLFDYV
jgi:hypothetical protein